jgi:hypothetical protein
VAYALLASASVLGTRIMRAASASRLRFSCLFLIDARRYNQLAEQLTRDEELARRLQEEDDEAAGDDDSEIDLTQHDSKESKGMVCRLHLVCLTQFWLRTD